MPTVLSSPQTYNSTMQQRLLQGQVSHSLVARLAGQPLPGTPAGRPAVTSSRGQLHVVAIAQPSAGEACLIRKPENSQPCQGGQAGSCVDLLLLHGSSVCAWAAIGQGLPAILAVG